MQTMFKGGYPRKDYPAQRMGEQQHQQTFETGPAAEITQGNNFAAQGHGYHPSYFSLSQIVIPAGHILLFRVIHIIHLIHINS